jgi:DNA-binding transcriptional regulator LsrR (DeoR family)
MTRSGDLTTLVRASRLYYELGETQETIARVLGITRPQVSRLLKQARTEGIVEIRIVDRTERPSEVADELARRFSLKAVHVAPTFAGSEGLTRRRVGRLAAQVLVGAVRDGMTVGIGDGSSIAALADGMDDIQASVAATIVPLCGGFWGAAGGHEPYRRVTEMLGATAYGLLAPGLLDDPATRDALAAHAGIRAVTSHWERLDVAAFGIGGPTWTEGAVGAEIMGDLERVGAVGEILISPFDIGGHFVGEALRGRTIACDPRALARAPISIAVASGTGKIAPILGALRTGVVGVLVTDLEAAEGVLHLADSTSPGQPHADLPARAGESASPGRTP